MLTFTSAAKRLSARRMNSVFAKAGVDVDVTAIETTKNSVDGSRRQVTATVRTPLPKKGTMRARIGTALREAGVAEGACRCCAEDGPIRIRGGGNCLQKLRNSPTNGMAKDSKQMRVFDTVKARFGLLTALREECISNDQDPNLYVPVQPPYVSTDGGDIDAEFIENLPVDKFEMLMLILAHVESEFVNATYKEIRSILLGAAYFQDEASMRSIARIVEDAVIVGSGAQVNPVKRANAFNLLRTLFFNGGEGIVFEYDSPAYFSKYAFDVQQQQQQQPPLGGGRRNKRSAKHKTQRGGNFTDVNLLDGEVLEVMYPYLSGRVIARLLASDVLDLLPGKDGRTVYDMLIRDLMPTIDAGCISAPPRKFWNSNVGWGDASMFRRSAELDLSMNAPSGACLLIDKVIGGTLLIQGMSAHLFGGPNTEPIKLINIHNSLYTQFLRGSTLQVTLFGLTVDVVNCVHFHKCHRFMIVSVINCTLRSAMMTMLEVVRLARLLVKNCALNELVMSSTRDREREIEVNKYELNEENGFVLISNRISAPLRVKDECMDSPRLITLKDNTFNIKQNEHIVEYNLADPSSTVVNDDQQSYGVAMQRELESSFTENGNRRP